jgi:hypothetical protein
LIENFKNKILQVFFGEEYKLIIEKEKEIEE